MRLICWIVALLTLGFRGHRWTIKRINPMKHISLMHLHTMAGLDTLCDRCGYEWLDAEPTLFGTSVVEVKGKVFVYHWDGPTHEEVESGDRDQEGPC